jgi:hypothetical protein
MIFVGFGFLMAFLRRYGFSAIGYTLLVSVFVVQVRAPRGPPAANTRDLTTMRSGPCRCR